MMRVLANDVLLVLVVMRTAVDADAHVVSWCVRTMTCLPVRRIHRLVVPLTRDALPVAHLLQGRGPRDAWPTALQLLIRTAVLAIGC